MSDTRSGRATDRVVGAAADENDEAVASWAELADDVAGHVDDFLTALDAVASGGAGAQAVALLLLEVSQVHFVGAQLGAAVDVIPRDNTEPAVAEDLVHGMRHYRAGRSDEALWWWQFSYLSHWGNHSGAALRALQAVVAHARLDTTPEPHPDEADEPSS